MKDEAGRLEEGLGKFPVTDEIVEKWVIPARGFATVSIQRGECLRLVDIEGRQVPDVVCFKAGDLSESLNLANSQLLNQRRDFVEGSVLYSVLCRPMMTIVGYSNALSFSYGSMCSEELNRSRYGVAGTRNCRDNLTLALTPWGIDKRQLPNAFVPFMNVVVDDLGRMSIEEPTSEAGDYYELQAEMDVLVAVSNCPQERNPCNGFAPSSMGVIVHK